MNFYSFLQASEIRKVQLVNSLITNEEVEPHRESSLLSMHFKIRKHHVRDGRIQISCEASMLNVWKRSKLEEIFVKTHNDAENLATPHLEHFSHASKNYCQNLAFLVFGTLAFNLA